MRCPTLDSKTELISRNTFVTKFRQHQSAKWTAIHGASEAMEERMAKMKKKLTEQGEEIAEQKEKAAGRNRQL